MPEKNYDKKGYRILNPEEKQVIIDKGTELPFSGEYFDSFEDGIYTCRRCGAMLYSSKDKFRCGCGWPSFDDCIKGAVKTIKDSDGVRTEIVCANCGAHLGHIFEGEHLTPKNIRHCVNSVSLYFVPEDKVNYKKAFFAGGCFWGVEYCMEKTDGVIATSVGYMGGNTLNPVYTDVCTGKTGHCETVFVCYDPVRLSYETLAKRFFEIHDPTQKNRQGPDIGTQYRSAVFYTDEEQKKTALKLKKILEEKGLSIATAIEAAGQFWRAEDYHQQYFKNRGIKHNCSISVFKWNES
ncbi:MAG: bifunctional methionine sulfoxide reductase B/A protein [Methanomicrobiaceae archaeon]|nr:bifunctional methionine sulfoxide reductase B/A protein [Methanomicrobiaceae archaeon]